MTFLFLNILDIGRHIVPWCLAVYQGTAGSCILPKEALVPIHTPFLDKIFIELLASVQFSCSGCPTLCNPMDCSTPGLPVHHQFLEFTQTHVHWVGDANHLILCHPLLLLPAIFPSISVFSNESAPPIRWLKYWSFSFSISPSNEYSGLISFRMDWLDLLAVQGACKSLLQHHSSKASFFSAQLTL